MSIEYKLVARPRGYYDWACACHGKRELLDGDIKYLCDADSHSPDKGWSLRRDVLVVAVEDRTNDDD